MRIELTDGARLTHFDGSESGAQILADAVRDGWEVSGLRAFVSTSRPRTPTTAGPTAESRRAARKATARPAKARKPNGKGKATPAPRTHAVAQETAPQAVRPEKPAKAPKDKGPVASEADVLQELEASASGARVEVISARLKADAKPAVKALLRQGRIVHLRGNNRAAVYGLAPQPVAPANSKPVEEPVDEATA